MKNEKSANEKRIIVKIADVGTYVGEPGWTVAQTVRQAAKELGLDLKYWEIPDDPRETKSSLTYNLVRKQAELDAPESETTSIVIASSFEDAYHWLTGVRYDESGSFMAVFAQESGFQSSPDNFAYLVAPFDLPFDDAYHWLIGTPLEIPAPEASTAQVLHLERKELLDALKIAVEIADAKGTVPILHNVYLKSSGSECLIMATDLERTWWRTIGSLGSELTACVPAKLLQQEVKVLPADIRIVELSFAEGKCAINGRCDLYTADPEEFPQIDSEEITGAAPVLVRGLTEALKRVAPAISTDQTRFVLTGAFLDLPNQKVVGTNGSSLHYDEVVCQSSETAILPGTVVKMIVKHGCSDTIRLAENRIGVSLDGGMLSARLIQGNFPAYDGVINSARSGFAYTVEFGMAEFLKLMDGASLLSEGTIRMKVNGSLWIESRRDAGEYKWQIPCVRSGEDGEIFVAFGPKLLLDAIRSFPADHVTMQIPRTYGAIMVNSKAVVMPVREEI